MRYIPYWLVLTTRAKVTRVEPAKLLVCPTLQGAASHLRGTILKSLPPVPRCTIVSSHISSYRCGMKQLNQFRSWLIVGFLSGLHCMWDFDEINHLSWKIIAGLTTSSFIRLIRFNRRSHLPPILACLPLFPIKAYAIILYTTS